MNLPLKVDKLDKYDNCIKELRRENLKKISKNRAKKGQNIFWLCFVNRLQHLKSFVGQ